MYSKEQKIKAIQSIRRKISQEELFTELDQEETEFLGSVDFLKEVSHKGLDLYLNLLKNCANRGIEYARK